MSVSKYFIQGLYEKFMFTALKMHEIKIKEFHKKLKNLNEYDPDQYEHSFQYQNYTLSKSQE